MKTNVLFAAIAALAILVGAYSATRHQAERRAWIGENDRLSARVEQLQQRVDEQARQPAPMPKPEDVEPPQELSDAMARLSKIEAEILHYRAELVQLKSDRLVAEARAKSSFKTLRHQVRKTVEIEEDLDALRSQKFQIQAQIVKAEQQVSELAGAIAARQDYASSLDQKIAELVVRQEAASSRLLLAEREVASQRLAAEDLEGIKNEGSDEQAAPALTEVTRAATTVETAEAKKAIIPAADVSADDSPDEDRSKGLYRFRNLSVEKGTGGPAPTADDKVILAARSDEAKEDEFAPDRWAKTQYELGRSLMIRGERNSGTRELSEAVLAFRAALGEWSKGDDSLRWSAVQNDLGYALALLGQRQGHVGTLEQAAGTCREALSAIDRDQSPMLWATAQYNLGLALSAMATIKSDMTLWQNAIKALQLSAEVFVNQGAKKEADKSVSRIQDAHDRLSALQKAS